MRQVLRACALGRPRGMGWGGRWEGGPGWGTHVNPWLIHVNVWQKPLQYCKVISLQLKKKRKERNPREEVSGWEQTLCHEAHQEVSEQLTWITSHPTPVGERGGTVDSGEGGV